jgi:hypothetical protein
MGALQIINEAIKGGKAATAGLKAADRAAAGRAAAELIKSQEQVKASEALGQLMEKGFKRTTTTQADRTRVGGGNIGGAPFSAISEADPNYAGKVWGVMDEGTAARLKNLTTPDTAWTTMLGSANQLKTNPIVFDKLKRGFLDAMKQGKLSDELEAKINHNLALTFGEGADIRDPSIWKQADTFEKRAALADLMMGQGIPPKKGGVSLGGEKSGKGVIFKPSEILIRETEPSLLHPEHGGEAPTFAAGPRLFQLEKESEFRPDLHPGFPTLIKGKDLGLNVKPTPTEVYLPEWHGKFKEANPERKAPGYYDLALGVKGEGLPSQELNDEYIRHLLREGFAEGGEVGADHPDVKLKAIIDARFANAEGMAEGGEVESPDAKLKAMIEARLGSLPDIEPAQEAPIVNTMAHKQHIGNQDISRTGVSAGANLGDMGHIGGGMNMTNIATGKDAQLMKELIAYYNNNVGDANINANLIKPMGGNSTMMNLMGSMPVGEGRVSMGLHGSNREGHNQLNARSLGYQAPMGGGNFNANITSPVHGSPSANVNWTKQFADGGEAHFAAGGSSRRKADVTEALTEGLAPLLYGGAKGAVSSLAGTLGELETIGRSGLNLAGANISEEPFAPNTKRVAEFLPKYRGSKVANEVAEMGTDLGENVVGTMLDPMSLMKGAKRTAGALSMLKGSQGTPSTAQAQRGVIKMPGGNWLKGMYTTPGNVEQGIERLRPYQSQEGTIEHAKSGVASSQAKGESPAYYQRMLEEAYKRNAVNKWVEGNLQNYVKKQMGTPEDPVRALHEQGITHLPKDLLDETDYLPERDLRMRRGEAGFPKEGMGQSELAKKWENLADENIWSTKAGKLQAVPEQTKLAEDARAKLDKMATDIKFRFNQEVLNKPGSKLMTHERSKLAEMPVHKKAEILNYPGYDELSREYQDLTTKTTRTDQELAKANPWVGKVDPNADLYSGVPSGLGFDHIIDVLKQDVEAGRIRPEQLNKVSMEQAVRRAHEFDQEQARKMAEAQIKATEGMPIHKEYPEGYKWVELAKPKIDLNTPLPEGFRWLEPKNGYERLEGPSILDPERTRTYLGDTKEEALKVAEQRSTLGAEQEKMLADALKYEGDTMGHCVGGYCPDVLEGRSRIYSLRDTKGEPHVTVEVQPTHRDRGFFGDQRPTGDDYYSQMNKFVAGQNDGTVSPNLTFAEWWRTTQGIAEPEALPPRIVQIKGKQNAAPKEDYLPFVQDFVKSGNWSDIGDFRNTGLIKQDGQIMTPAEHADYLLKQLGTPPVEGMKRGGAACGCDLNAQYKRFKKGGASCGCSGATIEQEYKLKKLRK